MIALKPLPLDLSSVSVLGLVGEGVGLVVGLVVGRFLGCGVVFTRLWVLVFSWVGFWMGVVLRVRLGFGVGLLMVVGLLVCGCLVVVGCIGFSWFGLVTGVLVVVLFRMVVVGRFGRWLVGLVIDFGNKLKYWFGP